MPEPVRYLGLAAFAERVGLSKGTLSRYSAEGRLPSPDVVIVEGGREARGWSADTIDQWQANRPGRGARTDLNH